MWTSLQKVLITALLLFLAGWALLTTFTYFGQVIVVFTTAGVIAFLLDYPVTLLEKWLPRVWAGLIVYSLAGVIITTLALILGPLVVEQAQQLAQRTPALLQSAGQQIQSLGKWLTQRGVRVDLDAIQSEILSQATQRVQGVAEGAIGFTVGTFGVLVEVILVIVVAFYMLLDGRVFWNGLVRLLPLALREPLSTSLQSNLRGFFVGQLILGAFMAVLLTPCFWLLGSPFPLLAGLFIGLMELIPFIGASIGILGVVAITALQDPVLAFQTLLVAVLIQQVKDNILAPRVLGNFTGLSPLLIFAALLLGAKVGGLLGVILAVPLAGVLKCVLDVVVTPPTATE